MFQLGKTDHVYRIFSVMKLMFSNSLGTDQVEAVINLMAVSMLYHYFEKKMVLLMFYYVSLTLTWQLMVCNLCSSLIFLSQTSGPVVLSVAQSKLRLCSANHRAGYFSNLDCDWLSIVWVYCAQETENGPWIFKYAELRNWKSMYTFFRTM